MGLFDELIDEVEASADKVRSFRPACGVTCSQYRYCTSPKMKHVAPRKGGVLFLLEEPSKKQDSRGDVFLGSFRKYVMPIIQESGISKDLISVAFAVACNGVGISDMNGDRYWVHLDSCRDEMLSSVIDEADPKVIVPMGKAAWDTLTRGKLDGRLSGLKYHDDICFNIIPEQDIGRFVAPTVSTRFLAELFSDRRRKDDAEFYLRKLKRFLKHVLVGVVRKDFPDNRKLASSVQIIRDADGAVKALEEILADEPEYVAFDYETDGLKLERPEMGIIMVGIASSSGRTYAMPFFDADERFLKLFRKLMTDRNIGKIAHHAKYEARCTLSKLGYLPHPWVWDTLYGARLLNNVSKSNLKYLTYMNFGISGYDTMESYMKPDEEERSKYGDNAKNRFREACETPEILLRALQYVGEDSLYTRMLYEIQEERVLADKHLRKGERLFRSLINPLVEVEVNGIAIDEKVLDASIAECTKLFREAEQTIAEDTIVKKYWTEDKPFEYTTDDLGRLLYEHMGLEKRVTEKGGYAVDSETLEDMNLPLCNKILDARKYSKTLDTYLMNIKRESVYDDKREELLLHSSYNLHAASTFRSSSSGGINMQNIPVRDPVQNNLIRSCIVPHKGTKIYGFDYKAMEVATGCCIHHDRNMLHFLETGGDMHMASAKGCMMYTDGEWEAEDKTLCKAIRQEVKGGFNFASFYGSYFMQTGTALWKYVQKTPPLIEHLLDKGIKTKDDYLEHMETMDRNLWEVQFPEYGQWRKEEYRFYQTHGYVDLITGFRCYGPMSKNNSTNSPIQGPASHVLLWAMAQTLADMKRRKMRSFGSNEIHDAQYIAVFPEEEEEVRAIAHKWMIDEVPNKFKWFTAPLAVELEYTGVREEGGNWASLSEYGYV